ncbi:MAG: CerR family C-terminal domain-containing protein [Planctomycetota bacterium]
MHPLNAQSTRAKLIEAATAAFVERGFDGTSIRDIASRADANVAAVSYHFGGKDELYRAVIQAAFEALPESVPMPKLADNPDDPEACLRAWIHWHLERVLGQRRHPFGELLLREMRNPTPIMRGFVERAMKPVFEALVGIVAELLNCEKTERIAREMSMSVLSQYVIYKHADRLIAHFVPEYETDPTPTAEMADRIADFSIAGLRFLRRN